MQGRGAADRDAWPLLRSERTWGSWRLAAALATAAAATWCYLIGEYAGYYLGFVPACLALTAGGLVGMLLVTLAAGPTCLRYGIESVASTVPQFGTVGWAIPALLQQLSIIGWNASLLIFFAKSLTQLLVVLGLLREGTDYSQIVGYATVFACTIVFLVLLRGATGVSRISNVLVLHVFVGLWMLFLLVSHRWSDLQHAQPALARPDRLWNYTTATEIGITSLLSWWAYVGAMIRMAPTGRKVAVPVMLGMGAPVPLLSFIGIAGILVLKTSDPSSWLRSVGGVGYAIVALAFVTAANFGTAIAGVYASAIGLRNFRSFERLPWAVVLLLTLLPVALMGSLIPQLVFEHFGTLLAGVGVAFAPLCGIQIADYFVLRRGRLDIRAIYARNPGSPYYFFWGVNPAALGAMIVGCVTYVYLLNPISYQSHSPYQYLTATLPTALLSALVYIVLTAGLVKPFGRGSYT
jgi:nucleobase:cation symporter-1, NCS1 family